MVVEAIERRCADGIWTLFSYVVMPNHVHMFLRLGTEETGEAHRPKGITLGSALHGFKEWTARQANRLLGRTGQFWQREWFDHWSRSLAQDEGIELYIRSNPVKAGLVGSASEWRWLK